MYMGTFERAYEFHFALRSVLLVEWLVISTRARRYFVKGSAKYMRFLANGSLDVSELSVLSAFGFMMAKSGWRMSDWIVAGSLDDDARLEDARCGSLDEDARCGSLEDDPRSRSLAVD